eukprot:7990247-Pyramimonas_sp.AAC.1
MMRICRQHAALALASFSYHIWRRVPSEHNASDPPSRNVRLARAPASTRLPGPPPGLEALVPAPPRRADAPVAWSAAACAARERR